MFKEFEKLKKDLESVDENNLDKLDIIIEDINIDDVNFEDKASAYILKIYRDAAEKFEIPEAKQFYSNPDAAVAELAVNCVASKYSLSDNWNDDKRKIYVTQEYEHLKTLVVTPLDKFIARGEGGKYWLKRSNKENIKIKYGSYLGKPYDLAFKFDNGKFYCSELIYDIYKNQLGIELCEPKKVSDYLILGTDKLTQIEKAMKKRGITKEQYAVAPVDIFESDYLEDVK